ncbi:MAG: ABC transporter ATP-binding protein [Bacteroidota bacterium]|nr:ABC transporter ATP-binding protein [Bacteroidota bacterium]
MQSAIKIENISKIYSSGWVRKTSIPALKDVSFEVNPNEIFALIGPNGAGKTTLIKILLGLVHATSGNATILGKPISDHSVRESVGYLPERIHYPPALAPKSFLNILGKLNGLKGAELSTQINKVLELLTISEWKSTALKKFSKGMLQRVGIAQALLHDPQLIFLDEPSDGLDPVGRKELRDHLKNLRDNGKTIFINSHLLSDLELVADRVGIINKGCMIKMGTLQELTKEGESFVVRIRGKFPIHLVGKLKDFTISEDDSSSMVQVPTVSQLNELLDTMKREDLQIESITSKKTSLEDSFLSIIGQMSSL